MPRLSLLLPVRDAADTLSECLASLRAQTLLDHDVTAFVEVDPRKIGERIHGAPVMAVADAAALKGANLGRLPVFRRFGALI